MKCHPIKIKNAPERMPNPHVNKLNARNPLLKSRIKKMNNRDRVIKIIDESTLGQYAINLEWEEELADALIEAGLIKDEPSETKDGR